MRDGLLALGVIILVLGAIFYLIPTPASANTDQPQELAGQAAVAAMILGALLTLLCLILPATDPFPSNPEQALVHSAPAEPTEEPRVRRKIKIRKQATRRH
jgi:hypothetical protein